MVRAESTVQVRAPEASQHRVNGNVTCQLRAEQRVAGPPLTCPLDGHLAIQCFEMAIQSCDSDHPVGNHAGAVLKRSFVTACL